MATTYGAPTALDLSACSVTATGGTTSQTLADLGKAVENNATAVATAQSDATDAKTSATNALETAKGALVPSDVGVVNGIPAIDSDGSVIVPGTNATQDGAVLQFGATGTTVRNANIFYNFGNGQVKTFCNEIGTDDSGTAVPAYYVGFKVYCPSSAGGASLGMAKQPFSGVFSQTAVVVTSDANSKTVAGYLGDISYADGQKLVAALATVKPVVYQLNDSIAEKGASKARFHVGYLAQDVEAAITKAGLDPSRFGLWTKTALTVPAYQNNGVEKPLTDGNGNQQYIQMLRYEEIFPVILAALSENMSALTERVSALEAKSAPATTGSAG